MAFNRPTLLVLIKRVRGDIKRTMKIVTVLRRSFINAISVAMAGLAHTLHGHLVYLSKQIIGDLATDEFGKRHRNFWGIEDTPATFAELNVEIGGDEGTLIPVNTIYTRPDAVKYVILEDTNIGNDTPPVSQIETAQTVADILSSLNDTYFFYRDDYYVLNSVDGNHTDPEPPGRILILAQHAEGDDEDTIAATIQGVMNAIAGITVSVIDDALTITSDDPGDDADIVDGPGAAATGFVFGVSTQGADLIEGIAAGKVVCLTEGTVGNLDVDESMTLESPIPGVESTAKVTSPITIAAAAESEAHATERMLAKVQKPPSGGDVFDYMEWAKEVAGVSRAWTYPLYLGMGTVGTTFVQDELPDIIPIQAKVDEVADYIEFHIDPVTGKKIGSPVTADVTVFAPTPDAMDMTIKLSPNTQEVRDAVKAELKNMIFDDAAPKGAWLNVDEIHSGTIKKSRMDESISIAPGEIDHEITIPAADYTVDTTGKMVKLGNITWQSL